jgi:two-component system response regulator DctR
MNLEMQIYIVEDDAELGQSLQLLFRSAGLVNSRHFSSPTEFLDALPDLHEKLQHPGCLLLDIRLPEMTGTELFTKLKQVHFTWPVIFMTGHGDLQMAVDLMQQGAMDYVTKPFDPMVLITKLKKAGELCHYRLVNAAFSAEHRNKLMLLSGHEQQIFEKILNNMTNREIAEELKNSVRTIETHRANILKKMDVDSALELAQQHERYKQINLIHN